MSDSNLDDDYDLNPNLIKSGYFWLKIDKFLININPKSINEWKIGEFS